MNAVPYSKTAVNVAVLAAAMILVVSFQNCGQTMGDTSQNEMTQQSSSAGGQDPNLVPAPAVSPDPMPLVQPAPAPTPNPVNITALNYDCREGNNVLICLGPIATHTVAEYSVRLKYNIAAPISCYFVKENRSTNLFCARNPYPYAFQFGNQAPIYEPIRTYFTTPLGSRCGTHFTGYTSGARGIDVICQSQGIDLQAEFTYLQGRFMNMKGGLYGSVQLPDASLSCRIGLHYSNAVVGPPGFNYITCSAVVSPISAL